jgi:hypothetical protein
MDELRQFEPAATQHLLSSPMQRPTDGLEPLASGSTKRRSIFAHWGRLVGQIRYKPRILRDHLVDASINGVGFLEPFLTLSRTFRVPLHTREVCWFETSRAHKACK